MVKGTGCTGSCESNYHTITTKTASDNSKFALESYITVSNWRNVIFVGVHEYHVPNVDSELYHWLLLEVNFITNLKCVSGKIYDKS